MQQQRLPVILTIDGRCIQYFFQHRTEFCSAAEPAISHAHNTRGDVRVLVPAAPRGQSSFILYGCARARARELIQPPRGYIDPTMRTTTACVLVLCALLVHLVAGGEIKRARLEVGQPGCEIVCIDLKLYPQDTPL